MLARLLGCLTLLVGPAVAPAAGQAPPPSADIKQIAVYLGFTEADHAKLMSGEIIATELEEGSDKQLAVSVALLLQGTSLEQAKEFILLGKTFEIGRDVIEFQRLGATPSAVEFESLGYGDDELKEVQRLLKARAGSDFNLSAAEIERFESAAGKLKGRNAARDPEVRETINGAMRAVLLERVEAYREKGLEGIAPYARGSRKTADPAEELALATRQDMILPEELGDFERALANYPRDAEGTKSEFFWVKQRVQKRPTFVLVHRLVERGDDYLLMAERHFYVGQSYNSLQIVAGAIPVDGDLVVFYRNRTSTDQVAGFGSGMKKGIGRGQMRDTIVRSFEDIRKALEKS